MNMSSYLADPIKTAIDRLGGPTKVSNLLGVSNGTVHAWIKTGKISDRDYAQKIAELSGISLTRLRPTL